MLTEQDVRIAISRLPPRCFIRNYVQWAEQQVSSPLGYHLAIGLCVAAATIPRDYVVNGFKAPTFANFYSMIVGRSGDAEKTLAINLGLSLLSEAAPALLGPDPTAEETLTRILSSRPSQLFAYPEMATFLGKTSGGAGNQRGSSLRDGFTAVFDGWSYSREYSKGQTIPVTDPRVSFLGGCTPRHLEDYTIALDWEGGFFNRIFTIYAERERNLPWPTPMPEHRAYLASWLAWSAGQPNASPSLGLAPETSARWLAWQADLPRLYPEAVKSERLVGLVARTRLIAAKVTAITAWTGSFVEPGWVVPDCVLEAAIGIAELHLQGALTLGARIASSHEMREQRAVLNAVGPLWTPLGAILAQAQITKRRATGYLESLQEQGLITHTPQGSSFYYRLVPGGVPRPYDEAADNPGPAPIPAGAQFSVSISSPAGGIPEA